MTLDETQKGVATGMALAAMATIAVWVLPVWLSEPPAISDTPAERLAFALPWQLLPLLSLFYGIAWLARYRFFTASAIHGDNDMADRALMAGRADLENTTEQAVLAFIAHLVLAIVLPLNWLPVLPVLAAWFVFCRIFFRLGYTKGAPARAFGFAGTFYPTVLGIAVASWFALT